MPVYTHIYHSLQYSVNCMLKMIYLQMPINDTWNSGIDALKGALKLEAYVTTKIRDIIKVCEDPTRNGKGFNDYHVCLIIYFSSCYHFLMFENFT